MFSRGHVFARLVDRDVSEVIGVHLVAVGQSRSLEGPGGNLAFRKSVQSDVDFERAVPLSRHVCETCVVHAVGLWVEYGLLVPARAGQLFFDAVEGVVFGHAVVDADLFVFFAEHHASRRCRQHILDLVELFRHVGWGQCHEGRCQER